MFTPSKDVFLKKAKKGNLIPVYTELLADLQTPVGAFRKLAEGDHTFLLESVVGGSNIGRYSFIGIDYNFIFKSKGNQCTIIRHDGKTEEISVDNPLEYLNERLSEYKVSHDENLPPFFGGAVGYIGYDYVRFVEKIEDNNPDELDIPELYFIVTDTILVFDSVTNKIKIISNAFVGEDPISSYKKAITKINRLIEKLRHPSRSEEIRIMGGSGSDKMKSNFKKQEFEEIVRKAKKYIKAGDILQVVLSQRFSKEITADPFDIYRALRVINPSPYMFYLKLGDLKLIGSSPEIMVKRSGDEVLVRPIAGTRKRGKDNAEDEMLEKDLLSDEKELAEHTMLVDLGRNDIGRISESGSVKVTEMMIIERYSHVMHIVSNVVGKLKKGVSDRKIIDATFPAGTVSGAPKVRAMEIIEELENLRRGPYAGAIGYFSYSGDLDSCITIRTIIVKDNIAHVQVGAGIVYDSVPEKEYEETKSKGKALFKAIEFAEGGLK